MRLRPATALTKPSEAFHRPRAAMLKEPESVLGFGNLMLGLSPSSGLATAATSGWACRHHTRRQTIVSSHALLTGHDFAMRHATRGRGSVSAPSIRANDHVAKRTARIIWSGNDDRFRNRPAFQSGTPQNSMLNACFFPRPMPRSVVV